MLKPTESPPPSFAPRFAALHHAAAAAGHDGPTALREEAADGARGLVGGVALRDARRSEERDGRPVDPVDLGEPAPELLGDPLDDALGVTLLGVEYPAVVHDYRRS